MRRFSCIDTNTRAVSPGLSALFPGWDGKNERLVVYSPHDDDAILGAGYAMRAAIEDGAEVYIVIVCSGNAGYSTPEERDIIVEKRRRETLNCYEAFGIPRERITFLGFSDFSALQYLGWNIAPAREGHFRRCITLLRSLRATRVLVPNHYHEHIDHIAAYMMGAYDAPQSGDAFCVDWADPYPVRSVAQYSVWADLDPEDALIAGRNTALRANLVLAVDPAVERVVDTGIEAYVSQSEIIADLVEQRKARCLPDGRFIEVYLRFDPRPKLSFAPYQALLSEIPDA